MEAVVADHFRVDRGQHNVHLGRNFSQRNAYLSLNLTSKTACAMEGKFMIRSFEVVGLPRQTSPIYANMFDDLNIITGRNGSGKTTILKLLWYVTSGNIEHALREVSFTRLSVSTDAFDINIVRTTDEYKVEVTKDNEKIIFQNEFDDDIAEYRKADMDANDYTADAGASVFFPTFRRIEGGFSIDSDRKAPLRAATRARSAIEDALQTLSRRLTVERHTFVSAISTSDIVNLLMRNYTEMSEVANSLQQETSQEIIDLIKNFKEEKPDLISGHSIGDVSVLDTIRLMIENMEMQRAATLAPLDAVRVLVQTLFRHSGIKLSTRLSFGDAANAVNSDLLSAGEKQMLSFICYNAFIDNAVIFIDEPELSLHVDWQRQLFPTLMGQGKSNQFIVATHSPFIYGKYPEKEILIGSDRGASSLEID